MQCDGMHKKMEYLSLNPLQEKKHAKQKRLRPQYSPKFCIRQIKLAIETKTDKRGER